MFKKLKFSIAIILIVSNILFIFPLNIIANSNSNSSESMRDVRSGWDVLSIYEIPHPPGPKALKTI